MIFKSGNSIGKGLTYQLDQKTVGSVTYCDTPGLSDVSMRKQAGEAISTLLKQGGRCKIFFVMTHEAMRVRPKDIATMRLVLNSAPEIGNDFGVIVNKCTKNNIKELENKDKMTDFVTHLFFKMTNKTDAIYLMERKEDLEDEENKYFPAENFDGFTRFMSLMVPDINLTPGKADDIKIDEIEEMQAQTKKYQKELEENKAKFEEEKSKMEEQLKAIRRGNCIHHGFL